jgi:hypothetical protein
LNAVENLAANSVSLGTYTAADGFFQISAVNGEVSDATGDIAYADGSGVLTTT